MLSRASSPCYLEFLVSRSYQPNSVQQLVQTKYIYSVYLHYDIPVREKSSDMMVSLVWC